MTSSSRSVSVERQARGRLVHDDQPGLERQRLGDLDQLPLASDSAADRRVGGEIDAELLRGAARTGACSVAAVDQPQRPAVQRLAADEDVGGDVEIVEQVELLVDEGDAGRDRARRR